MSSQEDVIRHASSLKLKSLLRGGTAIVRRKVSTDNNTAKYDIIYQSYPVQVLTFFSDLARAKIRNNGLVGGRIGVGRSPKTGPETLTIEDGQVDGLRIALAWAKGCCENGRLMSYTATAENTTITIPTFNAIIEASNILGIPILAEDIQALINDAFANCIKPNGVEAIFTHYAPGHAYRARSAKSIAIGLRDKTIQPKDKDKYSALRRKYPELDTAINDNFKSWKVDRIEKEKAKRADMEKMRLEMKIKAEADKRKRWTNEIMATVKVPKLDAATEKERREKFEALNPGTKRNGLV